MSADPKPGACYMRRWYDVERAEEQRHARVRVVGMGEDKPLVGIMLLGTFEDRIMTRIAFENEFIPCHDATHNHER